MTNQVSFPHLGLDFTINSVALQIGSKPIYWYALIILFGFLCGLIVAAHNSAKRGLKSDHVWDIAIIGIVVGIVCARIYYVLFALDEFKNNFWDVFKIWEGGLAIYGGIIGATISTCIYCRFRNINILNTLDVCCVGLLLGQAIGRWGNFMNCEVFGLPTDFFLGMSISGSEPVHPLFLYESLWNMLGVILILIFRDKKTRNGQVFLSYIIWYSIGRFFLEGMRNTNYILYIIPNILPVSQFVALLLTALSIIGFIIISKSDKNIFKPVAPITQKNN